MGIDVAREPSPPSRSSHSLYRVCADVGSPLSPTTESVNAALKVENADLREKLANLQLNFEMELSRRLDSESRAQTSSQNYKM